MTTTRLEYLMQQVLAGKASPAEWEEYQQLVMKQEETAGLEQALDKTWAEFHPIETAPDGQLSQLYTELDKKKDQLTPVRSIQWRKWTWAAASVLLISIAGIYYFSDTKTGQQVAAITPAAVEPGKDGAILTLSDGSTILLDSLNNSVVGSQSGSEIVLKDKQLIYQANSTGTSATAYNTLSTPRGRQFTVTLPDGSKVWLNAASSLRFPTSFNGTERAVQLTGEAFFEVAKNQQTPFIVKANDVNVKVLGTSFNLNAYPEENGISTTLLEGEVQVSKGNLVKTLQPGQQLIADQSNEFIVHKEADTDQVTAWKNGLFNFEGVGIQTLMRQLERWYDIEVQYPHGIPGIQFVGKISRKVSLQDLLEGLKGAGVNFRIENNRRLIVLP